MTKLHDIYKCELCGNIIEVVHSGAPALVCCDQEMKLLEEKTADATTEKHVPVIERVDGGIKIKVGSVPHPMVEDHYIEWIELLGENKKLVKFFKPGEVAEAFFPIEESPVTVREHCNKHGLWKNVG